MTYIKEHLLEPGRMCVDYITLDEFVNNEEELKYDRLEIVMSDITSPRGSDGLDYNVMFILGTPEPQVKVLCEVSPMWKPEKYGVIIDEIKAILGVIDAVSLEKVHYIIKSTQEFADSCGTLFEKHGTDASVLASVAAHYNGKSKQEIADVIGKLFDKYGTEPMWRSVDVIYKINEE